MEKEQFTKIIEWLHGQPDLPNEVEKEILDKGIMTGTYAFGMATNDSDLDIIMPLERDIKYAEIEFLQYNELAFFIESSAGSEYENLEGMTACYVILPTSGQLTNLLFPPSVIVRRQWIKATRAMKKICEESKYANRLFREREVRIPIFKALKTFYLNNLKKEYSE